MADYVIKTTDGTLLPTSEAAAQAVGLRRALGLGTLATENGTFSGTSSGTNTGDQTIELTGDVTGSGNGSFPVTVKGINGVVFDELLTGILKIVDGQVSTATAESFPTLNQDTTGTAAKVPATGITGNTLPNSITNSGLTSLGEITSGQWKSSTPVAIAYGGTGATTAANAFVALQPQDLRSTGSPAFVGLTLTGTFAVGTHVSIESTQGNISTNGTISTKASLITIANAASPTNITANDAGITIPSTSGNKTLTWVSLTDSWTSNQNFNISDTKTYKINGIDVLSSTTLGSNVISSSLTSVGTIGTGYWNSNIGSAGNSVTADQVIAAVNAGGGGIGTLDADLTAIAAISDFNTGYLNKTAANNWQVDSASLFVFQTDESVTNARYPIIRDLENVTSTTNGWMLSADKIKLDSISFNNAELTGIPTAPTADVDTKTTQIATTEFVGNELDEVYTNVGNILFNNILNVSANAITIDNTYLHKYVRLTNIGNITITLPVIAIITVGDVITFRRTTNAGAITLNPGSNVAINDEETVSVLGGDTFMIKYIGLADTTHTWDFI